MAWIFGSAIEIFGRYRGLWDEINLSLGNHILVDSAFVELILRHFASAETLLCIRNDGRESGIAIVEAVRRGLWQTFQPSQAPLGLILFRSSVDIVGQVHGLIRALPGYALGLAVLQQDPDFGHFRNVESDNSERLDYITTSRLTITGTFEDYWKTRSHNLRHNLARQRRRFIEQQMHFELVVHRDPERVGEGIQLYGELEGAGWKGQEGTAIEAENVQGRFYRELLEHFCIRGEGVIYRLDLNGVPIASAICLERNASLMVLKITYDENIPKCSPGLLLHEEMLRSLFEEKRVHVVEYYGRYTEWHRKWTSDTRQMYHINTYRYRWVASVRRLLQRRKTTEAFRIIQ